MKNFVIIFAFILFCSCGHEIELSDALTPEDRIKLVVAKSGKNLRYKKLTAAEVNNYLSANSESGAALLRGSTNENNVVSEGIIICYGSDDCSSSANQSCFGVWGTDDCGDLYPPDTYPENPDPESCGSGCCCYD